MEIKKAEFLLSAYSEEQFPKDKLPEIALVGRSNVGKSSFINCLVNKKGLAKTSSTPGKTQSINFYKIENSFYIVDLPGYGYANVPKSLKEKWKHTINKYLERENIRLYIQLVDIRHRPTSDDVMMCEWLKAMADQKFIIIATKADKVSRGRWNQNVREIVEELGLKDSDKVIPFSSVSGEGRKEVLRIIEKILEDK